METPMPAAGSHDDPRRIARIAGFLYVLVIVAPASMAVRSGIVIPGDALQTAGNLVSHESLFRLSLVIDLVGIIGYIGVTGLLYFLLRPCGRALSFTAALFSTSGCIVSVVGLIALAGPLVALGAGHPAAGPLPVGLALLPLAWREYFFQMAMTMFGVYCVLTGFLIIRANFMPRILGPLMMLSGASYLVFCAAALLDPALGVRLFPGALLPGIIGEGALTIWLLFRGVRADEWWAQHNAQ